MGKEQDKPQNIARIRLWRASVQTFLHGSRAILKRHGVSTRAYHAMLEIWAAPAEGLSIGSLAKLIHLQHNSTVGVVDQLCEKAYVARKKRAGLDKRVVLLELTDQGRMVLAALVDDHLRELNKVAGDLKKVL